MQSADKIEGNWIAKITLHSEFLVLEEDIRTNVWSEAMAKKKKSRVQ